ncbi:MAG: flavodoxin family protein [Nitrospirae bacterium]|nr:flavodoxin family protein [Nitrospirota bacterium]MBI5694595.1 flavodoxin family protein [Nitrospirota bacterium]
MKVLGISGSPRQNGNTELLLKEFLRGAADAGAETELLQVKKVRFDPCISCNRCFKTGRCEVEDAFQPIYDKLMEADHVVLASPIYFMTVSAWAKTLIDRCQCYWAKKYVLKDPVPEYRGGLKRKGVFISACGSSVKQAFDGAVFTMKFFFDAIGVTHHRNLLYHNVDEMGAIKKHPAALREAYEAGREIVEKS